MTALFTSSNDLILIGEKRDGKKFMVSPFLLTDRKGKVSFTRWKGPLVGAGMKVKGLLTGFTLPSCPNHNGQKEYCQLSLVLWPLFS